MSRLIFLTPLLYPEAQLSDHRILHSYVDLYTSTMPGSSATLVGKSIVVHSSNTTRLTCANFLPITNGSSGTSNATTPSATPIVYAGSATANVASFGAVAAGVLAVAAFFL